MNDNHVKNLILYQMTLCFIPIKKSKIKNFNFDKKNIKTHLKLYNIGIDLEKKLI